MLYKDDNGFIEFNPLMQSDRYLLFDEIGISASNVADTEQQQDLLRDFTVLAKLIKFAKSYFKAAEYKSGEEVLTTWDQIEGSTKLASLVTSLSIRYVFGIEEEGKEG